MPPATLIAKLKTAIIVRLVIRVVILVRPDSTLTELLAPAAVSFRTNVQCVTLQGAPNVKQDIRFLIIHALLARRTAINVLRQRHAHNAKLVIIQMLAEFVSPAPSRAKRVRIKTQPIAIVASPVISSIRLVSVSSALTGARVAPIVLLVTPVPMDEPTLLTATISP